MVQEKNAVISGFKAAGLYPFDPSAVDYDVFNKKKKSKTTVTKENVQDEVTEDKEKHLLTFENNLSKDILEEFNTAWLNQTLPRDLEIRGLYKYWLDISGKSEIASQAQSGTDQSENLNLLNLSDVLERNIGDELIFESNVLDVDNQTDFLDSTSAITTVSTAACTTTTFDKYSEVQDCQTFSQSVISKENDSISANKIETDAGNPFDDAFKMPTNYLPKKKRIKLESSGKFKLPSAGTSDQWVQYHSKKENDRKIKEEKLQKRKKLQEEKKLLAEEKKKLQDKMKAIQQKIKEETK
ncbi:uncharacterized protein LOC141529525 isoform X2 [Cotesia typhae]|uniref:uncharacterized protein LOC141529525 isoform X2 n=1 Tax=Cotesia typhae TaxID=2053667 RepID=UPI003D694F5C